jgi:hypothetical protein
VPKAVNCELTPIAVAKVCGATASEAREPTMKFAPLLALPETVTTRLPVVAPAGTGTTILVLLQLSGTAGVPLKVTVLAPWLVPKFAPVMVTWVPVLPEDGERLAMLGAPVKYAPLLATPEAVTMTFPVVEPAGTVATILVGLQFVGIAAMPLKVTALLLWGDPKPEPVIVTGVPAAAVAGDRLEILGVCAPDALVKVIVVEPQMEAMQAFTVAEPEATPNAPPWLLESLVSVAIVLSEEPQVTEASVWVLPSLKVPLAIKLCVPPAEIDGTGGVTVMELSPFSVSMFGENNSAEDKLLLLASTPPANNTFPLFSSVAVCSERAAFRVRDETVVCATGSKSSMELDAVPVES